MKALETVKGFISERKEAIIGAAIGATATLAIGFGIKACKAAKAIVTSDEESEDEETIDTIEELEEATEDFNEEIIEE